MLKKVYKLNFKKSSYDLNDDYERLSDHEKERISELDADTYFDYDDDDECYICYVITTQQEIDRYLKILTNNLIYNVCCDLSEDVLCGNINLSKDLKLPPNSLASASIYLAETPIKLIFSCSTKSQRTFPFG